MRATIGRSGESRRKSGTCRSAKRKVQSAKQQYKRENKLKMLYFLCCCFALYAFRFALSEASASSAIKSLQGHATIIWQTKKQTYRFDQIIVIRNENNAVFETLDDFGSTVMVIRLTPTETILTLPTGEVRKRGSRGKKIGLLPVGREDLIAALLHQIPSRDKKIKISFLEFHNFGRIRYPKIIRFETKKSSLTLEWQHVSFQR